MHPHPRQNPTFKGPSGGYEVLFVAPHRFSFNGQERTDEIAGTGNHNTALYWEYDTRLGRRWNVDPMSEVAPNWSPYRVLFCNPNYWTDPNGLFETRKEAKAFKKEHGLKGTITKDEEGVFAINGNNGNVYSFGTLAMKPVEVSAIKNVPQINKIDPFDGVPRQDFSGLRGILKYFWTGGNIGYYHYNIDGIATSFAPSMGMPPSFIGGPLRKGQSALKIGKYLFNPAALHGVKLEVLAFANPKNFAHLVGTNPDLMFKGGKVWLTGTKLGGYYGKSYETGMTIEKFLKLF